MLHTRCKFQGIEKKAIDAQPLGCTAHPTERGIEYRCKKGGHCPVHHHDGIEQPDLERPHGRHQQEHDQDRVLEKLDRVVAILLDPPVSRLIMVFFATSRGRV